MRIIFSAIALAAIATPVAAAPGVETVTVRVGYGDIDLNSAEGRAALEQRVAAEARDACTIETHSRYGYGKDIVDEKCVVEATTAALAAAERIAAAEARSGRAVAAN